MKIGGLNQFYLKKSTEQNNMEALNKFQVDCLSKDILAESLVKIKQLIVERKLKIGIQESSDFEVLLLNKIKAILCTLETAAYENIVKVVFDKLNLDDLFDNRDNYLK